MFAIIDIETTGGNHNTGRIIEIAIVVHDGLTVTHRYSSLVNPETRIPTFIERFTGITNAMVADAPRFYEVAKEVHTLTEGCIFVAHNAPFDYGFIKEGFRQLGFDYKRETLDTVRLARKIFPGFASYSLGKLCAQLGIPINGRHRALGDAEATATLFQMLLDHDHQNTIPRSVNPVVTRQHELMPHHLAAGTLDRVPNQQGVYFLHDQHGQVHYVGKSNQMRKRVLSHFLNTKTKKAVEMAARTFDVTWMETGDELLSLLLEASEISERKPIYNIAGKKNERNVWLISEPDERGYLQLRLARSEKGGEVVTGFQSMPEAQQLLSVWRKTFTLCYQLSGVGQRGPCFGRQTGTCLGACEGAELPETYNERVNTLLQQFHYPHPNLLLVTSGRAEGEQGLVHVQDGRFRGIGYTVPGEVYADADALLELIKPLTEGRSTRGIIRSFMDKGKVKKIIRL